MNTAAFQQTILEMIKQPTKTGAGDEPYFTALANSIELEITRDISVWWRCLQIEKYCVLSANYLKLKKCFDESVRGFYLKTNVSPYIEVAAIQFLSFYQNDEDTLLSSIAQFELNLIKLKRGEQFLQEVAWDYQPYMILEILLKGLPLDIEQHKGKFITLIGHEIEDYFRVIDLDEEGEDEE